MLINHTSPSVVKEEARRQKGNEWEKDVLRLRRGGNYNMDCPKSISFLKQALNFKHTSSPIDFNWATHMHLLSICIRVCKLRTFLCKRAAATISLIVNKQINT